MKPVRDTEFGNRDQWGQEIVDWYDADGFPVVVDDAWSERATVEQERIADLESGDIGRVNMSPAEALTFLAARYDWCLIADPGRSIQPIHKEVAGQSIAELHRAGWSLVRGVAPGIYEADTSADGYYLTPMSGESDGI